MPTLELLCESVEISVRNQNWYSALAVALTLPDICASLESNDGNSSGDRYARWFDENVGDRYKFHVGADREPVTFLAGGDCYALRCTVLHQGMFDISNQRARRALTGFKFIVPPQGQQIHCNMFNDSLQLQVDVFVIDIVESVRAWRDRLRGTSLVEERLNNMAEISVLAPSQALDF